MSRNRMNDRPTNADPTVASKTHSDEVEVGMDQPVLRAPADPPEELAAADMIAEGSPIVPEPKPELFVDVLKGNLEQPKPLAPGSPVARAQGHVQAVQDALAEVARCQEANDAAVAGIGEARRREAETRRQLAVAKAALNRLTPRRREPKAVAAV